MKKWKLITLICSAVLVVALTIVLIVIFTDKEEVEYKYPTVQPTIANPDRVYMEVGGKKITYKEMYDLGLVSYGLTTLIDLVDELIIDVEVTSSELEEHKKSLYASYNDIELEEVDLEDAEQTEKFIEQMNYQGYMTSEDIEAAIKLDLMRNKKAEEMLKEDIKNFEPIKDDEGNITQQLYFTDAEIEAAILSACPDKSEVIYITFRSESEAYHLMKKYDIDRNNLSNGWHHISTGKAFTKEEILDVFVQMYNELNDTDIVDNEYPVYTQVELAEVNTALAKNIFVTLENLETSENIKKCITLTPKKYVNGYYYLAVKNSTEVTITKDEYIENMLNGTTTDAVTKVSDQLFDTEFTSTVINSYLYLNRLNAGIKVYDEGIDIKYENSSLSALSGYITVYEGTDEESDKYFATVTVNGATKQITADQLFDEMLKRYGALLATEFINRYMFFNETYSSVYNYVSGNKYSLYDTFYSSTVAAYKEALETGTLETYGYSRNYGWENFITDYFGVQSEEELIMIGSAYSLAFEEYSNATFTLTNDTVNEILEKFHQAYELNRKNAGSISISEFEEYLATLDKTTYENTVVFQMINSLMNYFDVDAGTITFYVDKNADTEAEEIDEETAELGKNLIEALYYIAENKLNSSSIVNPDNEVKTLVQSILTDLKNKEFDPITSITGTTVGERLARLVLIYNNSSVENASFGVYKQAGIRLTIDQSSSYTDESATEELSVLLKDVWNKILKKELVLNDGTEVSFTYTEHTNTAVNAKTAEGLTETNPYRVEEYYEYNNKTSIVFVTSATNSTWYNYHKDSVTMFPTKTVGDEQVYDLERLEGFVRYYILSNRDESSLTTEEEDFLDSYASPVSYQNNYITNVFVPCYEELVSDDRISKFMYEDRKDAIKNDEIKFTDPVNLETYNKMMDLIFSMEE